MCSQVISIHAPHTGRDRSGRLRQGPGWQKFQSTRPIRGATGQGDGLADLNGDFNPRAPYGARPGRVLEALRRYDISIHAPHTGRDAAIPCTPPPGVLFQSTRPIRGATMEGHQYLRIRGHFNPRAPYGARRKRWGIALPVFHFNPRAPYGARLASTVIISMALRNFNPRAPYGARRRSTSKRRLATIFQSTRPIRGATTAWHRRCRQLHDFNPRAPYGARRHQTAKARKPPLFQSTRPIRGATGYDKRLSAADGISIHAPHTGRDVAFNLFARIELISIHAPHTGRDHITPPPASKTHGFQSTRPIRGAT